MFWKANSKNPTLICKMKILVSEDCNKIKHIVHKADIEHVLKNFIHSLKKHSVNNKVQGIQRWRSNNWSFLYEGTGTFPSHYGNLPRCLAKAGQTPSTPHALIPSLQNSLCLTFPTWSQLKVCCNSLFFNLILVVYAFFIYYCALLNQLARLASQFYLHYIPITKLLHLE